MRVAEAQNPLVLLGSSQSQSQVADKSDAFERVLGFLLIIRLRFSRLCGDAETKDCSDMFDFDCFPFRPIINIRILPMH